MKEFCKEVLKPGGICILILVVCGLLVLVIASCKPKESDTGTDPQTGVVYYKGYSGSIACPVYNADGTVKVEKEQYGLKKNVYAQVLNQQENYLMMLLV